MALITLPQTVPNDEVFQIWMLVQSIIGAFYSAPQIYTLYTHKVVGPVSFWTWALAAALNISWVVYGMSLQSVVVVVSSGLACVLATIVSIQWLYYKHLEGYKALPQR